MTWIFLYAEQMGEPRLQGYAAQPARLSGYHRSFNHNSTRLWGSPDRPCPILGLSPGGECWGLAFAVPRSERRAVLRQMAPVENADEYRRARHGAILASGEERTVWVWVSRPEYATERWPDAQSRLEALRSAHGIAGRGVEYVRTVVHALELWGLRDPVIESDWAQLGSWRPR